MSANGQLIFYQPTGEEVVARAQTPVILEEEPATKAAAKTTALASSATSVSASAPATPVTTATTNATALRNWSRYTLGENSPYEIRFTPVPAGANSAQLNALSIPENRWVLTLLVAHRALREIPNLNFSIPELGASSWAGLMLAAFVILVLVALASCWAVLTSIFQTVFPIQVVEANKFLKARVDFLACEETVY